MDDTNGRVAVVTGGASGLGRATAQRLAAGGARVAVLDRDEKEGKAVAKEIGGLFVACDVSERRSWRSAVERVEHELGAPTLAHLNAGVMTRPPDATLYDDPFAWIAKGGYRRICNINIDGVVFGLEALLPVLERAGGASVVATASTGGLVGVPFDPFYSMTKHAIVGLVRSLGPGLAERGVRIHAICPGGIDTQLIPGEFRGGADTNLMTPEEVAESVLDLFALEGSGEVWVKRDAGEPAFRCDPPEIGLG